MVLDWAKGKAAGLPDLLARKQFGKAVELVQTQLEARPRDGRLRLQLADFAPVVPADAAIDLELDRSTLDAITASHPRVREVLQRFYEQRIATSADAPASPGAA